MTTPMDALTNTPAAVSSMATHQQREYLFMHAIARCGANGNCTTAATAAAGQAQRGPGTAPAPVTFPLHTPAGALHDPPTHIRREKPTVPHES